MEITNSIEIAKAFVEDAQLLDEKDVNLLKKATTLKTQIRLHLNQLII
ncbi:hypothetical protein PL321_09535 [Caloramator sp. mosi_1]|nr:hypothetical protein [Caloramator sp. mosi_1]WDC85492.1 hypothetical protein PL321_09535 [Caloramator sp. mosi_1]